MKKSLIATAGVAAFAVAAVPAAVFAATSTSFTDNLTMVVSSGCTLEIDGGTAGSYADRTFTGNVAAGNTSYLNDNGSGTLSGSQMNVVCNTTSGSWSINYATSDTTNARLAVTGSESTKYIAPGASTSGDDSGWAIKSNAAGTTTNNFEDYTAPTTTGVFIAGSASTSATMNFNPSYQVYAAPTQLPGNYVGTVTYTLQYNS